MNAPIEPGKADHLRPPLATRDASVMASNSGMLILLCWSLRRIPAGEAVPRGGGRNANHASSRAPGNEVVLPSTVMCGARPAAASSEGGIVRDFTAGSEDHVEDSSPVV